jgi:TPR repeat protein
MKVSALPLCLMLAAPVFAQVEINVRKVNDDDVLRMLAAGRETPAREIAIQCANESQEPNCELHAAEFLLNGTGGKRDTTAGVRYLTASAEHGHPAAQALLGNLHYNGIGMKKDRAAAVSWWTRSAENCNPWAQDAVAHSYFDGEVVPRDIVLAYQWVSIAANFEYPNADVGRQKIGELLTPEQRAAGDEKIAKFLAESGCGKDKAVTVFEPGAEG